MISEKETQKLVSLIHFCEHIEPHKSPFCLHCCWLWKGKNRVDSSSSNKFGVFLSHTPDGRKEIRAHRAIWMAHHEVDIPPSMHLYQHCDRTLCCNPSHIFLFQRSPSYKDLQRCFIEVFKLNQALRNELDKLWAHIATLTGEKAKKPAKLI